MSRRSQRRKRKIVKQNGQEELFQPEKLCHSVMAVGVPDNLANQVCSIVDESIDSGVSTDKIFVTTRKYINEFNPKLAALYGLERGLTALGPSGFIFEQYVAALFKEMGYYVQTNVYVSGEGVSHEIDVWAEKGNVVYIIEAKYRNDYRSKTHINQVMYADAKVQDIRRQAKKVGDTREFYEWVVTNTQFTDNAINYVAHRDMQLMGWDYPKYINLKKIVSERSLYPVTTLPSITKKALKKFSAEGIILVKELAGVSENDFMKKFELSRTLSKKLVEEVKDLI
ncbi:MAG: restriction endonuclease [Candidatus Pacebacteria bacterium]|nr:restriction endonuclease [Candidatus Paceibacterota bacterium]